MGSPIESNLTQDVADKRGFRIMLVEEDGSVIDRWWEAKLPYVLALFYLFLLSSVHEELPGKIQWSVSGFPPGVVTKGVDFIELPDSNDGNEEILTEMSQALIQRGVPDEIINIIIDSTRFRLENEVKNAYVFHFETIDGDRYRISVDPMKHKIHIDVSPAEIVDRDDQDAQDSKSSSVPAHPIDIPDSPSAIFPSRLTVFYDEKVFKGNIS